MADGTAIEWTRADDGTPGATWNPIRGCSRVSPGCGGPNHEGGCYAEKIAARFSGPGQPFEGFAVRTKHGGRWTGKVALVEELLTLPLRWRKPRRIFANSMSDLFHENLPDEAIDKVFAVMALCSQHTFQVLTKRAERMRTYLAAPDRASAIAAALMELAPVGRELKNRPVLGGPRIELEHYPLPNVWLGVSVEDQSRADERIPLLLDTPAAVRWISAEPLLESVDLRCIAPTDTGYINALSSSTGPNLNWIVAGGESGPGARPVELAWARSLREQCAAAEVPYFWKQWGAWAPMSTDNPADGAGLTLEPNDDPPEGMRMVEKLTVECAEIGGVHYARVGKKKAGALLDGKLHREFPR